jgi:hypothetical protein
LHIEFYSVDDKKYYRWSFSCRKRVSWYSGVYDKSKNTMTWTELDMVSKSKLDRTLTEHFLDDDRIKAVGIRKKDEKETERYEAELIRQKDPQ